MHGRPRKAPTHEEEEASSLKAIKLRNLQSQFLSFHHNKIYTKEALDLSAKLLESNPEHYTGWNYRKLAVQHLLETAPNSDSDSIQPILDDELRLVENALKKNFKSYGAWHHRKWILSKGHSSTDREMRLLGKFQKLDSRNFHAWNYRRFITELKKISDEDELQYTTDMIYDNFSNYSAWHNRSVLLSHLLEASGKGYDDKEIVLGEEFEFVRNALFTDPDDQSGWFYHLWLLDQTLKQQPLLLSSWPPLDSDLYLSVNAYAHGQRSLRTLHFHSKARKFPIILCFSEAVRGVSSSNVTVDYEYHTGDNLNWRPISANKFGFAKAWLTYLNFPDEVNSLKSYPVKVTVAELPGIISSSGMFCSTSRILFTVTVSFHEQESADVQNTQRISWKEEDFTGRATEFKDEDMLQSLSKLKITMDNKSTASEWSMKTISTEMAHCRELLSSTNCKIGKLTLARLLMAHNTLISYGRPNDGSEVHYDEILALYRDLMMMDPKHFSYYEDEYSLALLKQVTSSTESLSKYINEYQDSTSTSTKSNLCLRLNGLSLSRIGSMKSLLWVQMLDLSHNKLQSIEGLEVLQLLSHLNLSNNKLCSFTALEPIKLLKSLEVLNISYNEIGAHSIDTRRYLCASPLTHAVGNDWSFEKFANGDIKLKDHWEPFVIFKDLNLIQLDITGNAATNDQMKAFLVKLMPTLKWLDGDNCS